MITYDEHGGFWDHVNPPTDFKNPNPERPSTPDEFDFTRLGPRVPAILVSPWVGKGVVDNRTFEHSSVPATVKAILNLTSDFLTVRDKESNIFVTEDDILD